MPQRLRTQRTPKRPLFTGYIIARLNERLARRIPDKRLVASDFTSLVSEATGLGQLFETYRVGGFEPLVPNVDAATLRALEEVARASEFPPLHSLTAYILIDARSALDPRSLVRALNRHWSIDIAYREQRITLPAVTPDPLTPNQGYLDPAPAGIDARYAWSIGVEGTGMGFVDLERAWLDQHEDLKGAPAPTLIFQDNYPDAKETYHGTAVLSVVAAKDNALGIVGVAPSVASVRMVSLYDQASGRMDDFTQAVAAAILVMKPGDVLLLETQLGESHPVELDPDKFDAIRLAAGNGIVVVECGGNGGGLLDDWVCGDTNGHCLDRNLKSEFRDSGAIMVASCDDPVVGGGHQRHWSSNYGSRLDCYAWGQNVWSAGDPLGAFGVDRYSGGFSGTSSAGAIIAGAALLLQSRFLALTGGPLSPSQVRAMLSDPATGTPRSPGTEPIGVMPDLRQVLAAAQLVPDIYLRDALGDDGSLPSSGANGTSPDIILTNQAVPPANFGQGSGTENSDTLSTWALAGQDNFIYVRMQNRGTGSAAAASASVYWSKSSTLLTPADWTFIAASQAIPVTQGAGLVVPAPITWHATDIPAPGHYCFLAILNDPADPAPVLPGPLDWNGFLAFVSTSNNVAWRNFDVMQLAQDGSWSTEPFWVRGAPDQPRSFSLEFRQSIPKDLRLVWEVSIELLHALPQPLRAAAQQMGDQSWSVPLPSLTRYRVEPLALGRDARYECRLWVQGNESAAIRTGQVSIRQLYHGQVVGGMTWEPPPPEATGSRGDR